MIWLPVTRVTLNICADPCFFTWAELPWCLGIPRNTQLFSSKITCTLSIHICIYYVKSISSFSQPKLSLATPLIRVYDPGQQSNPHSHLLLLSWGQSPRAHFVAPGCCEVARRRPWKLASWLGGQRQLTKEVPSSLVLRSKNYPAEVPLCWRWVADARFC